MRIQVGKKSLTDMQYITNMSQLSSENARNIINVVQENEVETYSENEELTARDLQEINVGVTFENKRETQVAVCYHALTQRFNFKIDKSCTKCYFVSCVDVKCGWKFKASSMGKTGIFKVRKFNDVHTCSFEDRFKENRHATSKFIANVVKVKYRKTTSYYGPINIQEDVKDQYGINIDYHKAWRAKEKMTEKIVGKASQSYSDLPSYLHMVKKVNPGTVAKIKTLDDRYNILFYMNINNL